MENSRPSEQAVLALGRLLVTKLDEQHESDVLAKWMAHHIAGLIKAVEISTGTAESLATRQSCMTAILQLWAHRNLLPIGTRPFESAEAAMQTLVRLDPDRSAGFYMRARGLPPHEPAESMAEVTQWLQSAEVIDDAARSLVRYCLGKALDSTRGELRKWLDAANAIEDEPTSIDVRLVARLVDLDVEQDLARLASQERNAAIQLRSKLDALIAGTAGLRSALDKEIGKTGDKTET